MIPNYWNVLTNLGFLWIGLLGLYKLLIKNELNIVDKIKINYAIFFIGVTLVAFGSGYYHWHPNNQTLIWDRMPMTIAFMALLSIAFGEFLSLSWGKISLWPLLIIGLVSVFYWYWGELHNVGDLRLYMLVQFLPMIILPILFIFGKTGFQQQWGYWLLLLAYILAKLAEQFDAAIFKLDERLLAGHAIKHVLVVLGIFALLQYFQRRTVSK